MDDDLGTLSREQLIAEAAKLRHAIRVHRDSSGHELCWHHPDLWSLLPEGTSPAIAVPAWPQFMRGCIRYRQSLDEQAPQAPRMNQEFNSDPAAQAELQATVVQMESQLGAMSSPEVAAVLALYRELVPRFQAGFTASSRDVALARAGALMLVQAIAKVRNTA